MTKKNRDINIELFRILAMFMVVTTHCIQHTNLLNDISLSTANYIIIEFINILVAVANSSFLMISGYYAINSKTNIKKIFILWGKTICYSISIYIIYAFFFNKAQYVYESFMPILSGQYWFISAYISLYLLLPVINIMIHKLSKNQFKYLLIVLIVFYGIIRITFNPADIFSGGFIPVICIYLVGAYIRLYVEIKEKQYYILKYLLVSVLVTWLIIIANIVYCNVENMQLCKIFYAIKKGLSEFSNILLILSVTFLFMKFKTMELKNKTLVKLVTLISPSVFSIYIIHENINNRWIWSELLNLGQYNNSYFLLPYILFIIICVFAVCLIIDIIRRVIYKLLKKIPFIELFIVKLNKKFDSINQKLSHFLL